MKKYLNLRTNIVFGLVLAFLSNTFAPIPLVQAQEFSLPAPGAMVHLSPAINPPVLKGIKVDAKNPFRFEFILDQGDKLSKVPIKQEAIQLIKYFLTSLTIPENDLWVNLSPYEKDRIIPYSFGLTEMGRDLLAEDYMLKQVTASLIYPEEEVGKRFWRRIYQESLKRYGTTDVPVNTFNKVWIVPEKAVVYENVKVGAAYVVESKLKVMLEQDYLSLQEHEGVLSDHAQARNSNQLGSQIVREIVIPELTREVNEGKNFAKLRQVYNSLILATWYKKKIKDSILGIVYKDKNKLGGIKINDPREKERIYQRYLKAFRKGVYNYIKEDAAFDLQGKRQGILPRRYFSGGVLLRTSLRFGNEAMLNHIFASSKSELKLDVNLAMMSTDVASLEEGPRFTPIEEGGTILAFGTSTTKGVVREMYSFPSLLEEMIGHAVVNAGEAGERAVNVGHWKEHKADGLSRLPGLLQHLRPKLLILWHGRNDFTDIKVDKDAGIEPKEKTDEDVGRVLTQMIEEARKYNCQVLLIGTSKPNENTDAPIYRKIADENGVAYLSNIEEDIIGNKEMMFDKMHANAVGNLLMAKRIAKFLWERGALSSEPDDSLTVPNLPPFEFQKEKFIPELEPHSMDQHLGPDGVVYFTVGFGNENVKPADVSLEVKLKYWVGGWSSYNVQAHVDQDYGFGWFQFRAVIPPGVEEYTLKATEDGDQALDHKRHWVWSQEHIMVKREQFFRRIHTGKIIVAFGSSSTSGYDKTPGTPYPDQLEEILMEKYRVYNEGVAGERIGGPHFYSGNSPGGLARWRQVLASHSPESLRGSLAIIWHGRNDILFDGRNQNDVYRDIKEAVLMAQAKGMQVLVLGAPNSAGEPNDAEIYRRVAQDTGSVYLPNIMHDIWGKSEYMLPDGIHVNKQGNRKVAEKIVMFLGEHGAINDKAQIVVHEIKKVNRLGGIDFTANKIPLEIQNAGWSIKLHIDPQMLRQFQNATGFVPVIINIQPMTDLRQFLGLNAQGTTPTATG